MNTRVTGEAGLNWSGWAGITSYIRLGIDQ